MIWEIDLAWIASLMGLFPCRTFCECAVGPIEISVARGFIGHCRHMILIEPNPTLASNAAYLLKCPVLKTAVGFQHGIVSLVENGGSSYIAGTWAPTPVAQGIVHATDCITFDEVDDGEIDILALDCEGMEWAVLSRMRSIPELLTIEIWEGNPYKREIYDWLRDHNYKLRFTTGPTTETRLYTRANSANT
jgi:methyltransferase FkbM-like protein